jgi:hypothetical protein
MVKLTHTLAQKEISFKIQIRSNFILYDITGCLVININLKAD